MSTALEHIRAMAAHAYEHGFHELGYDPVDDVEALCSQLAESLGEVVEDGLRTNMKVWQHKADAALARYKLLFGE